jgi:hypothetical protein
MENGGVVATTSITDKPMLINAAEIAYAQYLTAEESEERLGRMREAAAAEGRMVERVPGVITPLIPGRRRN